MAEGDTLIAIADAHALTVAELDAFNDLGGSTMIRPGQVLVVRRPVPVVAVASVSMPLTDESRGNARTIVEVGRSLGVPDQGIVIALAAAAQESGLRNLRRRRPRLARPVPAATEPGLGHAGGGARPRARGHARSSAAPPTRTPARTRGLLDVTGWESHDASRRPRRPCSISAHPDHYAKWEAQRAPGSSELG